MRGTGFQTQLEISVDNGKTLCYTLLMWNINDIPKDLDITNFTYAEVGGKVAVVSHVSEAKFDFEEEADTFVRGMDYMADRTDTPYVASKTFFRRLDKKWVIRIVVGNAGGWYSG